MISASRTPVLAPAAAAAGIASSLIAAGFGLLAFVAGAMAASGHEAAADALLLAPVAGAAAALVCGLLGLVPALVWVASAVFVGPPILQRLRGPARGITLALACTAPAFLAGQAIAGAEPLNSALPAGGMELAVIGGGLLAGALLAWFVRHDASAAPLARRDG